MEKPDKNYTISALRNHSSFAKRAAGWFHTKWDIPAETYLDSIQESIRNPGKIPQWYWALDAGNNIIAGCGLIENDFHARKDLTPNLCALYVEPDNRGQGIAKAMLDFTCRDAQTLGFQNVYLLTDHTNFYEQCGWTFVCLTTCNDGNESRIYISNTMEVTK